MLNKQEITPIILITIIIAFAINLVETVQSFLYVLLFVFLVIILNILAKKVTSYYLDSEIEVKLWEINRYGFKTHKHFKKSFPAGAFFPIVSKVFLFPFNSFVWMASLVFDVKAKTYRAARRHGLYKFTEMTEYHIAHIAAAGIVANLLFGILGYLMNYPEFARLNLYYAFFNMLPFSNLDGNKIFFGSLVLWSFLATIVLIGLVFAIFVISLAFKLPTYIFTFVKNNIILTFTVLALLTAGILLLKNIKQSMPAAVTANTATNMAKTELRPKLWVRKKTI